MKYIAIVTSFFVLLSCSTYESAYQESPLTIDGSSLDWKTSLNGEKSDVSYGISNDNENLYLRFTITDQNIQRKIFMTGLNVWIDTTGKKKDDFGITCPIQNSPAQIDRNALKKMNTPPEFDKNQILEAEFIGFSKSIQSYYVNNNPYNVKVSMDIDEFKIMYYEMLIPLSVIYSNSSDLSKKTLSIGFETDAIKMPERNEMSADMSGSRPSGMGGRAGSMGGGRAGGMKGGSPSGMSGNRPDQSSIQNLTTPTKFWIKNIVFAINE